MKKATKDRVVTIRVTVEEKKWLKEEAEKAGSDSVSEFLLDCARKDRREKE